MFKTAIGHSDDVDSEDAIREALEQCRSALGDDRPQAGILFAAIDHEFEELVQAVDAAFPGLELIGCTTDGEVSSELKFAEDSLNLTLFCSDQVEIRAGVGRTVSVDPVASARAAVAEARAKLTLEPRLCVTTPESLTMSAVSILDGLHQALGPTFPIFGGTAGDQWRFAETRQFYKNEVLSDSVPILLFAGPLKYACGISSGWTPIGKIGMVTAVEHNTVQRIDEGSALEFYQHYLRHHLTPSGEYPLAVFPEDESEFYLRAPISYDAETGSIVFAGDVPANAKVQITQATRDNIVHASQESIEQAVREYPGTDPRVALCFSCAARKQVLGTRTAEEFEIVARANASKLPIAGFYAYGEIAPLASGHQSRFHNETFISLLLGVE